jgi:hypothetical protein
LNRIDLKKKGISMHDVEYIKIFSGILVVVVVLGDI